MKWEIQVFKGTLHPMMGCNDVLLVDSIKKLNIKVSKVIYKVEKNMGAHHMDYDELMKAGYKLIEQMKDPVFLNKVAEGYKKDEIKLKKVFERINSVRLKDLSNDELAELYKELYKGYSGLLIYGFTIEPMDLAIDDFFKNRLDPAKIPPKYFSILTTPPEESFAAKNKLGLLKIALIIKEKGLKKLSEKELKKHPEIYSLLEEHQKEFFWLETNYYESKPADIAYFIDMLKDFLRINDIENEIKKIKNHVPKLLKEKKELLEKIKPGPELKNIVNIIEKWAFIHDARKESMMKALCYYDLLFREMAKRFDYERRDFYWMVPDEIINLFKGKKFDRKLLEQRKDIAVAVWEVDKKPRIYSGEEARKHDPAAEEAVEIIDQIKGICASSGKVSGKVRVILDYTKCGELQPGEILVTTMTRPEYVPAMERSAAVVTDQGGLTSHAAIISREFGIPCIVGTKIATKALKTGDVVEVNADHSTVRVIERCK